jgi:hypothetical protein
MAFFSVRVENTVKYWSFCQNTADLHLSYWPPMPLQSIWILPYSLLQTEPGTLPERECEALFSPTEDLKKRINSDRLSVRILKQKGKMIYSVLNTGSICTDNLMSMTSGSGENDRNRYTEE